MLGTGVRLADLRGRWIGMPNGARLLATVHPSWVLRQRGDAAQAAAYRGFVEDLALLRDA